MDQFSSAWKLPKLSGNFSFESQRMILDIKTNFLKLSPSSGEKYSNSMTQSLSEKGAFVTSYLPIRTAIKLKFCGIDSLKYW